MKMNIQITKVGTKFVETDEEIVNIDINNGNWKYNDNLMETEEKIGLTINTIRESHYLCNPVKDAYPIYNHETYEEEGLKVTDALVRTYHNLLTYLNCRINNVKEDYKKGTYDLLYKEEGETWDIIMFEPEYISAKENDVTGDIVYNKKTLINVTIKVVE